MSKLSVNFCFPVNRLETNCTLKEERNGKIKENGGSTEGKKKRKTLQILSQDFFFNLKQQQQQQQKCERGKTEETEQQDGRQAEGKRQTEKKKGRGFFKQQKAHVACVCLYVGCDEKGVK